MSDQPETGAVERRPRRRRRAVVAAATVISLLAAATVASADEVYNTIDNTIDANAENVALTVGGSPVAVTFKINPANGDGKNGCNFGGAGSPTATFAVDSSATAVATVSPASVIFNACGDNPSVTVTPGAAGTATVSLRETANNTGATFDLAPATFTVTVGAACAAAPTTAPTVSESNTAAATGWYNASSLPAAFTVSPGANAEYRLDGGTWQAYTGEVVVSGDGVHTAEARTVRPASTGCPRVDGPASSPLSLRIDRTVPSLTLALGPDANAAGWNNSAVTADWSCADAGSGLAGGCPADAVYGNGTNLLEASFTVLDGAGNSSASVVRRAIKVDTVAPTLTVDVSPAPNGAGWNNTQVTGDWTCTDAGSGFTTPSPCPTDETFGEADSPVAERTVTVADLAGNSTTTTRRSMLIDETAPSVSVTVTPDANADGWNNTDVAVDWTCSDGGSGLATACPSDGTLTAEGAYSSVTATVTDNAGHTSAPATRRAVKIDKTAPLVTVTLRDGTGAEIAPNGNAWFNQAVTVDFTCADPTSGGVSSGVGTADPCPADFTLSTDGDHLPVAYDVADKAGNHTTGSTPAVKIDTTRPVLEVSVSPDANTAGWNRTTVNVSWTCTENGSGLDGTCPAGETYGNGTDVPAVQRTIKDLAGNTSEVITRRAVKVDTAAPTLSLAIGPDANTAGWNKTDVTADWTCGDTGGSGLVAGTCPTDATYGDGTNIPAASFSVADVAGNTSATVERRAVKVDTVAPTLGVVVSPAANAAGWNSTQVTANWTCTDAGSGFETPSPCPADETFGEADSPVAERTVTVADLAGNSATATRRAVKVDETAPSLAVAVTPDANTAGWNNTDVAVDWTCSDGGGSGLATTCPADETLSDEGEYQAQTETVTDNAGHASPAATRRAVKIDKTAPLVTVTLRSATGVAIAPNADGWFSQAVTVDYDCSDPISGDVASGVGTAYPCPADFSLTTDGVHAAVAYDVADRAGNHTAGTTPAVKIDKTAPVVSITGLTGSSYVVGAGPTPGCSTTDALSGVATPATVSVTGGDGDGTGVFTVTCSGAMDDAGNAAGDVSASYTVGWGFAGFFQPITDPAGSAPSSFRKGSTVPVKFALLDAAGRRIPDAVAQAVADGCRARLAYRQSGIGLTTPTEATATGAANDGSCFRYDAAADQFVFNLGTKDMAPGGYELLARIYAAGSGVSAAAGGVATTAHAVGVGIR